MLTETQLAKANLATIKTQHDKIEVKLIKEEIEALNKKFSEINSEKSNLVEECETLQNKIESAKKELIDMNSKIYDAKSELDSLQAQNETKKKEIICCMEDVANVLKNYMDVYLADFN